MVKKKFIKCPVCALNYIHEGEDMCKLCKDNRKESSLVNTLAYEEQEEYSRKEKLRKKQEEINDYNAYRYNRKHC